MAPLTRDVSSTRLNLPRADAPGSLPDPILPLNTPDIGPHRFLLELMHCPSALLAHRIEAALRLIDLYPDEYLYERQPVLTIKLPPWEQ